jgi:hypothetical protein
MQREASISADLYALATSQCIAHEIEQMLDCQLDILRWQMLLLAGQNLD